MPLPRPTPHLAPAPLAPPTDPRGVPVLMATDQQPIRCTRCGDEDGPFTDEQLCEPCARPMPLDGVA
ncbi:hypothetical protein GCM10017687_28170 [Streptomyces echinatus]